MKYCYPKNASIVVSYESIYLTLKLIFDEHIKTLGQIVRYDYLTIKKGLSKYIDEPMFLDEILGDLLFNGLIQENSPIEHVPTTYTISLKGAKIYSDYIESPEYLELLKKAEIELGKKIDVDEIFLMNLKSFTIPIAYNFFVSYLEKK